MWESENEKEREHTRKKRVGVRENIGDDCIKASEINDDRLKEGERGEKQKIYRERARVGPARCPWRPVAYLILLSTQT